MIEDRQRRYDSRETLKLHLIVIGTGTTVSARVLYELGNSVYLLLAGPDAPTHRQAYERLLPMTCDLLNKKWSGNVFRQDGVRKFEAATGGTYNSVNKQ